MQLQEAERVPIKKNPDRPTPRLTIIKTPREERWGRD